MDTVDNSTIDGTYVSVEAIKPVALAPTMSASLRADHATLCDHISANLSSYMSLRHTLLKLGTICAEIMSHAERVLSNANDKQRQEGMKFLRETGYQLGAEATTSHVARTILNEINAVGNKEIDTTKKKAIGALITQSTNMWLSVVKVTQRQFIRPEAFPRDKNAKDYLHNFLHMNMKNKYVKLDTRTKAVTSMNALGTPVETYSDETTTSIDDYKFDFFGMERTFSGFAIFSAKPGRRFHSSGLYIGAIISNVEALTTCGYIEKEIAKDYIGMLYLSFYSILLHSKVFSGNEKIPEACAVELSGRTIAKAVEEDYERYLDSFKSAYNQFTEKNGDLIGELSGGQDIQTIVQNVMGGDMSKISSFLDNLSNNEGGKALFEKVSRVISGIGLGPNSKSDATKTISN